MRFFFTVMVLWVSLLGINLTAWAQQHGANQTDRLQWRVTPKAWREWVTPNPWPVDSSQKMTAMEYQLYNRTYPADTLEKRAYRLEQSLGLTTDSVNKPDAQLKQLEQVFQQSQQQPVNQKTRGDIGLLESRLLQNRFDQWPMPQRLAQLEQLTFGQTYETDNQQNRLNRLYEQIPLSLRTRRHNP